MDLTDEFLYTMGALCGCQIEKKKIIIATRTNDEIGNQPICTISEAFVRIFFMYQVTVESLLQIYIFHTKKFNCIMKSRKVNDNASKIKAFGFLGAGHSLIYLIALSCCVSSNFMSLYHETAWNEPQKRTTPSNSFVFQTFCSCAR